MQSLTKSQARRFALAYLRGLDVERAAAEAGVRDGMGALGDREVRSCIGAMRSLLAEEFRPEDIVRRMAELAFGRANDCVRLALDAGADLDALDLSLLAEIKRNDKGTVEIKLIDRLRVLERLLALERGGEDEAAAFFRAMQAAQDGSDWEGME